MPNDIRYLCNTKTGIELIFCNCSTISYPLHNHVSVLTIGIVLDGSIILSANQERKIYTKNQIFMIAPYVPHSISAHTAYTLLSLCINKNILLQYTADAIQNNIMSLLINTFDIQKINQYQILQLLSCQNSFKNLFTDYFSWNPDRQNSFISQLKRQLELYPETKLNIEEMAQSAFISKYHFIRSFQAQAGLTPHQFQLQNRIRKAQRFIHKSKTITEVALATGFCDQSHFIKQFKKQIGLSPSAYKLCSDVIK